MGTTTRWMTVVAAALAIGVAGVAHGGGPTNDRSGPSADAQSAQVKGNTEFCFNLYAKLRDRDGNLFFSPYSMSTALAMTSAGARGPTADQMVSTLHLPPGGDRLHQAFGQLNQRVTRAGSARKNELAVANALWSQAGLRILPGFQRITRDLYGAGLQTVDFARAPEKARATINAWVEQQTQDRIKDLVPEGAIATDTRLVVTNAVYFKGAWRRAFSESRTRSEAFTLSSGRTVSVPMMSQDAVFPYFEGEAFQALALPYAGDELSMIAILPRNADGLAQLENTLTEARVADWLARMTERPVDVRFPRFKITAQFQLMPTLSDLGMPLAFSPGRADFSGIAASVPLYVSDVLHKAYVEVTEKGTEAAAATGAVMVLSSAQPPPSTVFRADHPFVFFIRDNQTGSILFAGRVADPVEK